MLRLLQLICITLLSITNTFAAPNHPTIGKPIQYDFTYDNHSNPPTLKVSLIFHGNTEGKTTIELPDNVAGITELYKNISHLTTTGATLDKTDKPNVYSLSYKPNDLITITYDVTQGWEGPPVKATQFRAPILQNEYFQFKGRSVLIYPKYYANEKQFPVTLKWHLPPSWVIANSYDTKQTHQQLVTNMIYLSESLFLGGDYRLTQIPVEGGTIWTSIRGSWHFTDKDFNQTVKKIILTERNFWNDHYFPYYLVNLIPIGTVCKSQGGTGLNQSFTAFMGSDCVIGHGTLWLIAHEYFHTWNKPSRFMLKPDEKQDRYYAWFTEGFTNYYAGLFLLKSDLISFEEYINNYNRIIKAYYTSPAIDSTITDVQKKFWKNHDVQLIPYEQGEIIAHNWNAIIKQQSGNKKSLDNLMKALINTKTPKLSLQQMNQIAEKFMKPGIMADVDKINQGQRIEPNSNSLGPCVNQTMQDNIPQFTLNKPMWDKQRKQCLAWFFS